MDQAKAKLNSLHIAPRKVRLICNSIKGLPVNTALAHLQLINVRSSKPISKLIKSAVSNAKNKKMNPDKLIIKSIMVGQGPMLKRYLPRARGSATPLHKKFSNIDLILQEAERAPVKRFTIYESHKKIAKKIKTSAKKPKFEEIKEEAKPKEKKGFLNKMFRRKSI